MTSHDSNMELVIDKEITAKHLLNKLNMNNDKIDVSSQINSIFSHTQIIKNGFAIP